ncbi:MAG: hypothetical protein J6Q93_00920, partial [Prevotella sp.]|nr:hypothetical protein [Prevotella sp.]
MWHGICSNYDGVEEHITKVLGFQHNALKLHGRLRRTPLTKLVLRYMLARYVAGFPYYILAPRVPHVLFEMEQRRTVVHVCYGVHERTEPHTVVLVHAVV